MLVGRGTERAVLTRRLEAARRGAGRALLLIGEPGVGKTALISEACARAKNMTVLQAAGAEAEASLPFSVLADLATPLLDRLEEVPPPQAAALRAALALGPGGPGDRFAAFAGMLGLLAAAAECTPLFIAVDDAHWLDGESAEALAFCARRIHEMPILILLSVRDDEPLAFDPTPFERTILTGLDAGASAQLLGRASGVRVDAVVAERLQAATAGNPLALTELARLLTPEQLGGRARLDDPLPLSASVERLFSRQVADQPPAVQIALLVGAASMSSRLDEIEHALPALGTDRQAVEGAETAGLVTIADGRLRFKHPLLRAVAYGGASAAERRAAHCALAEVTTGTDAPLRRAWHRAHATAGTDEEVAQELERLATDMVARTGFAAAADALERAAILSAREENRARRFLGGARAAQMAGLFERARAALRKARESSSDPQLLAECAYVEGSIELYAGDLPRAHRLLLEASELIAPRDPVRAAEFLTDSALPLFNAGDIRRAAELSELGVKRAEKHGGETSIVARKLYGGALILLGRAPEGYKLMIEGLEAEERAPMSMAGQLLGQWGVLASLWVEDYARARAISDAVLPAIRTSGALSPLPYSVAVRSELEFRTGDWDAALVHASEAVAVAYEVCQKGTAAYALVTAARAEAGTGREAACYEHAEEAVELAERHGVGSIHTYARAALGLLELGLSRPERAHEHLEPLSEITVGQGLGEPGTVCWQPDLIETEIRLGELDRADEELARLEREASAVNRTWALAAVARYRGLMAADGEFEQHFNRALEFHRATPTPFDLARTELCLGERLRRAGERRAARDQLTQALSRFQRLGAAPWVTRTETELAAAGARHMPSPRPDGGGPIQDLLTAQELQVALAVAHGKTNKEAAAALFLSPKTIEFHLSHIYRKLGVRSRTELVQRIASAE